MKPEPRQLSAGLYFVATPIGSARDITLRALDILAAADAIAAEDTRSCRKLLGIHGIALGDRPLIAWHDHSAPAVRARLVETIRAGKSVAYASEAGTPLIADPGFALLRDTIAAGLPVTAAPGPSALMAALSVAGLPTDRFYFAGFPPVRAGERRTALAATAGIAATVVYFESPKRVQRLLDELCLTAGEGRRAAVCRELTKKFEEVRRGTLGELRAEFAGREVRGEIVVVVDRGDGSAPESVEADLREALKTMSLRDAADAVAGATGRPRRDVYRLALTLGAPE